MQTWKSINTLSHEQYISKSSLYLTQIHDDALMDLLPQMGSEDLNEGDLKCGDLAMHENACQIQLHLETNVHLYKT